MKRVLRAMLNLTIGLMIVCSMIIPRADMLAFCNPMDQVMLTPCCHPEVSADEADQTVIHRPSCCDDVEIPDSDLQDAGLVVLPAVEWVWQSQRLAAIQRVTRVLPLCPQPPTRSRGPPDKTRLYQSIQIFRI